MPSCIGQSGNRVNGFAVGTRGISLDRDFTGSICLKTEEDVVVFSELDAQWLAYILGRIVRVIAICTVIPGIFLWIIGNYFSNPEVVGKSRIRMLAAIDHLLREHPLCYGDEIEKIASSCDVLAKFSCSKFHRVFAKRNAQENGSCVRFEEISRDGNPTASNVERSEVLPLENFLKSATEITLSGHNYNSWTIQGQNEEEKLSIQSLEILNAYPNIRKISFSYTCGYIIDEVNLLKLNYIEDVYWHTSERKNKFQFVGGPKLKKLTIASAMLNALKLKSCKKLEEVTLIDCYYLHDNLNAIQFPEESCGKLHFILKGDYCGCTNFSEIKEVFQSKGIGLDTSGALYSDPFD
ncbi:MAG: hypothetical protein LBI69_03750 [Puniceicoccales bacterium]|jgi:hypothetical protein|nr:hypothetical protein [Puniceicoccales bacterium]